MAGIESFGREVSGENYATIYTTWQKTKNATWVSNGAHVIEV